MAELMADGAYAVYLHRTGIGGEALQLHRTGIVAEIDIVFLDIGIGVGVVNHRSVGPEKALVVAAVVGAVAGHDKVDQVYHTVAVAVILAEIDLLVGGIDGVDQDADGILRAFGVILAVVHRHGAHDIKLRLELAVGAVAEVVVHTAVVGLLAAVFPHVAGVVHIVHHVLHNLGIVAAREGTVVELHQYQKAAKLAVVVLAGAARGHCLLAAGTHGFTGLHSRRGHLGHQVLRRAGQKSLLGCRALCLVVGHQLGGGKTSALLAGIYIEAAAVFHHGVAVGRGSIVQIFIAMQLEGHGGAVGLGHSHLAGMGGDGSQQAYTQQEGCGQGKESFLHCVMIFLQSHFYGGSSCKGSDFPA